MLISWVVASTDRPQFSFVNVRYYEPCGSPSSPVRTAKDENLGVGESLVLSMLAGYALFDIKMKEREIRICVCRQVSTNLVFY